MNIPSPMEQWVIRYGPDPVYWPRWTRWRYRRFVARRPELADLLNQLATEDNELRRALLPDSLPPDDRSWLALIPERHGQATAGTERGIVPSVRLLPLHYAIGATASLMLGFYLGFISNGSAGPTHLQAASGLLSPIDESLIIEVLKEGGA